MREEIRYPAQMGQPASVGTAYLGYDASTRRWVYSEIDAVGEYFTNESASPHLIDSTWTSVLPTGNVSAIRMRSRSQYTVDGRYAENGKMYAFHQLCTRS